MTILTRFVTAFALLATFSSSTSAQTVVLHAPPISSYTFTYLTPTSLQFNLFSVGWDHIQSAPIATDQLIRVFYRKSDGLTVAIIEDSYSNILAQSRLFTLGTGADVLNVTLLTRATTAPEWKATVVVFAYNRITGLATRMALSWPAVF